MATGGTGTLTLSKPILFCNVSGSRKLYDLPGQDTAILLSHDIICLSETWDTETRSKPEFFQFHVISISFQFQRQKFPHAEGAEEDFAPLRAIPSVVPCA